jgi:hypothetical protein
MIGKPAAKVLPDIRQYRQQLSANRHCAKSATRLDAPLVHCPNHKRKSARLSVSAIIPVQKT